MAAIAVLTMTIVMKMGKKSGPDRERVTQLFLGREHCLSQTQHKKHLLFSLISSCDVSTAGTWAGSPSSYVEGTGKEGAF